MLSCAGLAEDRDRPHDARSGATRLSQPIVRMAAASRIFWPRREVMRLLVISFIASSASVRIDCTMAEAGCNI